MKRSIALFFVTAVYSAPHMHPAAALVAAGIALGAAIFYSGRGE